MTAELVRGQNLPLPEVRLEVRVRADGPVVAGATLGDEHGTVTGGERVARPGAPALPGIEVSGQAAADHRIAVDLAALPGAVHRVSVLLALPSGAGGPVRFGAVAAPLVAVTGPDGTEVARYTITGLDTESAVVALEFYRRQGAWKVRAVGQGYAGGLADLLADLGLPEARQLANTIDEATAQGPADAVAAPPPHPPGTPGTGRIPQGTAPAGHADEPPGATRTGAADAPQSPYGTPDPRSSGGVPSVASGAQDAATPPYADVPGPLDGAAGPHDSTPGDRTAPHPGPAPTAPYAVAPPSDAHAVAPPASATDGPVDYTHPHRRTAPPPPSPPTRPAQRVVPPAGPGQPTRPVAGDATGWSLDERLYNQVRGMFEDLARTTAAYRSAVDFADSRRERELDKVLSDPRERTGGRADAAREEARARHSRLVDQAREALDRDLAQLRAEADVVEPALPPAYARWDNPVWQGYQVPTEHPMALRLGDLHLPESTGLRIPLLVRLPLERGLWVDSGRTGSAGAAPADTGELRRLALDTATALAARLLAVHPPGEFTVHVLDPAGSGTSAFAPLLHSGLLAGPPATGAAGAADVLGRLTQRVDLVQMAVRGGAPDALPPGFDTSGHLLIVNDFPHGFDDRAVTRLRYLADEGPAVGVHLMLVADREDAVGYGPLLDPLWRALLRLTPVPDDHLADPWVGHAWTYEPALVPSGSQVLRHVLTRVAAARRIRDR
ncbi:TerD family protein [Streptomyces poonensis]|uniref:Export associated protein n=1 Tax=Streptomyces poonensis TaxID=68255 RepID=A0A918URR9_9ACTN|nr:TerD family protein [Streptomyces poonensis]GGZ30627.1 export associated protein [Streptomyces poonensis]GLJ88208.1 export associated protein [Streptomyces poonensis]